MDQSVVNTPIGENLDGFIQSITLAGRAVAFETFKDKCSTFVYIPLIMDKAGTIELIIKHPPA